MAALYEDKFNCTKCLASQRDPKDLAIIQDKKGCFKVKDYNVAEFSTGWKIKRCPGRLYGKFETDLLRDYQHLRDWNALPSSGAMGDQPAWWVDAMSFIRDQENEYKIQAEKKRELEARRG
jgi:hypothetical protein